MVLVASVSSHGMFDGLVGGEVDGVSRTCLCMSVWNAELKHELVYRLPQSHWRRLSTVF